MNDFFTWTMLGTYAGATLATSIITQFIKGVGFIDRIPTRFVSYAIALVVLVAANAIAGTQTFSAYAICVINAVVVSLAANGAFDALKAKPVDSDIENEKY